MRGIESDLLLYIPICFFLSRQSLMPKLKYDKSYKMTIYSSWLAISSANLELRVWPAKEPADFSSEIFFHLLQSTYISLKIFRFSEGNIIAYIL